MPLEQEPFSKSEKVEGEHPLLIIEWERRLWDLGAFGVRSKVWVLTIGVLEVNPE